MLVFVIDYLRPYYFNSLQVNELPISDITWWKALCYPQSYGTLKESHVNERSEKENHDKLLSTHNGCVGEVIRRNSKYLIHQGESH